MQPVKFPLNGSLYNLFDDQTADYLQGVLANLFGQPQSSLPKLPPTQLNAQLDVATATDGAGHILSGSGIPDHPWLVQEKGHFEVGTYVGYRTGDLIQPVAVERDGTIDFVGHAGAQVIDAAHNVSAARADRGAMAQGWSFDTGANGTGGAMTQQQFLAAGGKEIVKIDLDPGKGEKFLTLEAKWDPAHATGSSGVVLVAADNNWLAQGIHKGDILVNDNGGNAYTFQNTTNLAFFNTLIDHDPYHAGIQSGPIAPAGDYGFEVQLIGTNHQTMLDIHTSLHLA